MENDWQDFSDGFTRRHIGPSQSEQNQMLQALGLKDVQDLMDQTIPSQIRSTQSLSLPAAKGEHELLRELAHTATFNQVWRTYIGMGYSGTVIPSVVRRNVLENPGWYTQYTPYQSEISQGRLEALLNFQTLICDLTGLDVANASLLDEATAAAEAMHLSYSVQKRKRFLVSNACHPQTMDVLKTRAKPFGIEIVMGDHREFEWNEDIFGVLLQYPGSDGTIWDYRETIQKAKSVGALVTVSADILSLLLLKSPGELGADIAVGSTQRFGVPMGYGGPHAAFFATKQTHQRRIPGRIVGVSKDRHGRPGYRLALQTREQHIRRDKATSNICTAQVLLAILASMYAVYHGPERLKHIASRVHRFAKRFAAGLEKAGLKVLSKPFFDTVTVELAGPEREAVLKKAEQKKILFRETSATTLGVSFDETVTEDDLDDLLQCFGAESLGTMTGIAIPEVLQRQDTPLQHPVFHSYRSETEMLRYIRRLESRDLSLTTSMIPLGSCTMKLNSATQMLPITWSQFANIHPFAPIDLAQGYEKVITELEGLLKEVTGFDAVSMQPNAGSQGEYAGLLAISRYHESRNQKRDICLIPKSAHGTNPASATMAGMKVVVVSCDESGNVDLADLKSKAKTHSDRLAALMVTYPSTHGVFEEAIQEICEIVHHHGGQVYMDGANFNALVGYCFPPEFGPDVCHLNLHKTFAIPHGGGGPGMGPIGVKKHLEPFLPGHFMLGDPEGAVSAAPWGSAGILPISWAYIRLLGSGGMRKATEVAILNANYIAHRLQEHYPVLYRGSKGRVAHECIIDLRPLKATSGVEVEDVAKRLMDYGFHAPTVSFPVAGTMMIEPTESESLGEIDRFCEAMIQIRKEIWAIEQGGDRENNLLKNAPHPASVITADQWNFSYSREQAAYPAPWTREHKYWPVVSRIDNVYGDRNLFCTCPPIESE